MGRGQCAVNRGQSTENRVEEDRCRGPRGVVRWYLSSDRYQWVVGRGQCAVNRGQSAENRVEEDRGRGPRGVVRW